MIGSFSTVDGIGFEADPGTRLALDAGSGLESWGVKDPAVVQLPDGSYLMVDVTVIP